MKLKPKKFHFICTDLYTYFTHLDDFRHKSEYHRGERLKKFFKQFSVNRQHFCHVAGIPKATLYLRLKEEDCPWKVITAAIAYVNNELDRPVNEREWFPDIDQNISKKTEPIDPVAYDKLIDELSRLQKNYIQLLEEHKALLKECGKTPNSTPNEK